MVEILDHWMGKETSLQVQVELISIKTHNYSTTRVSWCIVKEIMLVALWQIISYNSSLWSKEEQLERMETFRMRQVLLIEVCHPEDQEKTWCWETMAVEEKTPLVEGLILARAVHHFSNKHLPPQWVAVWVFQAINLADHHLQAPPDIINWSNPHQYLHLMI